MTCDLDTSSLPTLGSISDAEPVSVASKATAPGPLILPDNFSNSSAIDATTRPSSGSISMKSPTLALAALILTVNTLHAGDWPRHLGPTGNSTAATDDVSGVPLIWSDTENLLWKVALPGAGSSSPIVVGGRIFMTSYTGTPGDDLTRHVSCHRLDSGEEIWKNSIPAIAAEDPYSGYLTEHGYASNSPTSDGESVFVFLGKSGVRAYSAADGKELWQAEVGTGSNPKRWGSASSPILYKNALIVIASDEARTIFAFDKATGDVIWKEEAELLTQNYTTPIILRRKDGRDDLVINAVKEMWGLNPMTGKIHWWATHGLPGNISPSPVVLAGGDDPIVMINGGYPRNGRLAIRPAMKGETPTENILWDENNGSYVPTPVVYEGHVYWMSDQGFALCSNAETGELVYKERVEAIKGAGGRNRPVYASPILVGDRVICVSRHGGAVVIAAKPEFEVLAHNKLTDEAQFNGTPAVAQKSLLIRSDSTLYRIGLK